MIHKAFLILLALTALSCSKNLTNSNSVENFDDFYNQFHESSSFQMERIKFPIEGTYVDAEGIINWEKSNWVFHESKLREITEPDYDLEIVEKEELVIEKVKLRGSGYQSERRFQRIDGQWFLIYYDTTNL